MLNNVIKMAIEDLGHHAKQLELDPTPLRVINAVADIRHYSKQLADIEPLLPRWVPCSERLPEPGVDVLVTNDDGCFVDCLCNDGTWSDVYDVTHWMPLPPLPDAP